MRLPTIHRHWDRRRKKHRECALVAEAEPHTCRDGREIWLDVWEGSCEQCGAPYLVRTKVGCSLRHAPAFGRIHCDEHKQRRRSPRTDHEGTAAGWHLPTWADE